MADHGMSQVRGVKVKPTYSYLIEEVVFRDKEGKFSFTGPACVIRFTGRWRVVNKELYVEVEYYDYDYELRTIFVNSCKIIETEGWSIMECGNQKSTITGEIIREGVRIIKRLANTRTPKYQLPADSFIEEAVRDILNLVSEKLQ